MFQSPPLLGLDHFILALERNDTSTGTSGHSCRYILDLEGEFDLNNFNELINKNEIAEWLSSLYILSTILGKKKWAIGEPKRIVVEEITSDEIIPNNLAQTIIEKENAPLFFFSVVKRSNNKTSLIFSWHHLLMDGYGAVLFLENLISPIENKVIQRKKSPVTFSVLKQAFKAKRFVDSNSSGKIETMENVFTDTVQQKFRFLSFTKEESKIIEINATKNGSRFGISSYYLACTSITVAQHHSLNKDREINDFWIPVPQDTRKKGSKWPITGNHLSFLFYRIKNTLFTNKKALTMDLNQQMISQIKNKIPSAYSHLMNYMRNFPTSIYAYFIKGPNGKSLSSFLFTVAAEHPKSMTSINDCKIINAISVPPNSYPPGLTFAFNRFEDKIQLVIPYYSHLFNEIEMNEIEKGIRRELLNVD